LSLVGLLGGLGLANAQTGVSDGRVSLPEGPGSLEGVGDNARADPSTGAMAYDIPIDAPEGFEGVTPALALTYSSSAGSGVVGIGWDLAVPFIERMTNRGLPDYDTEDAWVANGGEQLVRVEDAEPATYRARYEKGFVRYRWFDRGAGEAGYWTAESPDGVVSYFGADHEGTPDENARLEGARGVFRYQLAAVVDPFGHVARYRYGNLSGVPYLESVEYTFTQGVAQSRVTFEYEDRPDPLSDARSGFNELRTHRLSAVNVYSVDARIWRYTLTYEPTARSGGLSRLGRVSRVGLRGTPDPITFDFEYSKTLANDCGADCAQPYLVDMGSLGVSLASGSATLLDINGDGLPDVLDTSVDGPHRFFINRMTPDGPRFDPPFQSASGLRAGHDLRSPYTQVLDLDGDGRADIINVRTGVALINDGSGDWASAEALGDLELPDFALDFDAGSELAHVRFFDFDNDRRIDILRSSLDVTEVFENRGAEGFAQVAGVEPIGYGFADARLDLADMNGDGLLDPVLVRPSALSYRLNLGRGRWSAWRDIQNLPFDEAEMGFVELEDLNGDSISDLVLVIGSEVRFAINRNGTEFQSAQTIDRVQNGALPTRDAGTTVRFADMDGNGSDEVVWFDAAGRATSLTLFPVRPNLLSRITNGLGMTTDITYTTSVQQQFADPAAWDYTLPFGMQMVASQDTYEALNQQHDLTTYRYRSGFYDPDEKQFRGFARVEILRAGDATQQARRETRTYDVGADDPYRHGLLLTQEIESFDGMTGVPLRSMRMAYDDCEVGDVPAAGALQPRVRFICETETEQTHQEGAPPEHWITTRSETEHDAYGNPARTVDHGIVSIGGVDCGAACLGDESYTESTYVLPADAGGRWMLSRPRRVIAYDVEGADFEETSTYYDGPAFVGLPSGRLTLGLASRVTQRVDDRKTIDVARSAYDAHGNVVESLDPRADPARPGFRARMTYDADGLLVTSEETELLDADGAPYLLRQRTAYDPHWGQVSERTNSVTVVGGVEQSAPQFTRRAYDDLGRVVAVALPGDAPNTPTTEFSYDYGSPVTRIVSRQRTRAGAAPDTEVVTCYDGLGRALQRRTRLSDDRYEVSGFSVFNRRGEAVRVYRPYVAADGDCERMAPEGVAYSEFAFDALDRPVWQSLADAGIYGSPSARVTERGPLTVTTSDVEDLDLAGPFARTPTVQRFDGLGRLIEVEYVQGAGQPGHRYRYGYDALGNMRSLTDPDGNQRTQDWDAAGRPVRSEDPDRGLSTLEHDDAGNVIRMEDAAGRVVRSAYDALGRLVAQWDEADEEGTRIEYRFDDARGCPEGLCTHAGGALVGISRPTPDGEARAWYAYNGRQSPTRVAHVIDTEAGGARFDFAMEYDNLERQTAEITPDGTRLDYTLDSMGRVVGVPGFIDAATYDRGSLPSEISLANGIQERTTFDAVDRLAALQVQGDAAEPLLDLAYNWRRSGLLTGIEDRTPAHDGPRQDAAFDYDALYRLTGAAFGVDGPEEERLTYRYDAINNLVEKSSSLGAASPSHVGELTYGRGAGPHAAVTAGALTLAYDAAGYEIERGDRSLTWDFQGRLVETAGPDGELSSAVYGVDGNRLIAREGGHVRYELSPTFEIEDGMALVHLMVAEKRVATRESATMAARVLSDVAPARERAGVLAVEPDDAITAGDAVVASRVAAGEVDLGVERTLSPVSNLLRASARRMLLEGSPRITFNHHDHARNVVAVTDEGGRVIERRAYDPYGTQRSAPTGETTYGYSGRRTDSASGLSEFGSRAYDALTGRWTAPDSLFRLLNPEDAVTRPSEASAPYLFNLGNPITFRDPGGTDGWDDRPLALPRSAADVVIVVTTKATSHAGFGPDSAKRAAAAAPSVRALRGTPADTSLTEISKMMIDSVHLDQKIAQRTEAVAAYEAAESRTPVYGAIATKVQKDDLVRLQAQKRKLMSRLERWRPEAGFRKKMAAALAARHFDGPTRARSSAASRARSTSWDRGVEPRARGGSAKVRADLVKDGFLKPGGSR
jgi:RHS repeat-associated protein